MEEITENLVSKFISSFRNEEEKAVRRLGKYKWDGKPLCPYCDYRSSTTSGRHRWHCKRCDKNFSIKQNTIMHGSNAPVWKWMAAWVHFSSSLYTTPYSLSKYISVNFLTAKKMIEKFEWYSQEKEIKMFWDIFGDVPKED